MKISENCTATVSVLKKNQRIEFVRVFSGGQITECGMFLKNNITNYDDAFNFVSKGYRDNLDTVMNNSSNELNSLELFMSVFVKMEPDTMHYIFTGRSWKVARNGHLYSLRRMTSKL